MDTLINIFTFFPDARKNKGKQFLLRDILVMSVCAIICGYTDFQEIADFCEAKKDFFIELLDMDNEKTPSHSTFSRVFRLIDAKYFLKIFIQWISGIVKDKDGQVVAIDGKAAKGATDKVNNENVPYVVNAFLTDVGLSIGQIKVKEKSNEIKAIPELLEILELEGCIVTIDAIGTQTDIVEKILEKKSHYVLPVKNNHKDLYEEIKYYFNFAINDPHEKKNIDSYKTIEKSHGRIETRKCFVSTDLECIYDKSRWRALRTIAAVINTREINGKVTEKTKYYLSDLDLEPLKLGLIARKHWQIENKLHWVLDIHFDEDLNRSRKDNSIENLTLLRKLCFNLIKLDKSFGEKVSIKRKMNFYSWDLNNLKRLIFEVIPTIDYPSSS